jgi:UDP-3-O-[3-hydroxymyristoyl] glucosamine N-acyltransferase
MEQDARGIARHVGGALKGKGIPAVRSVASLEQAQAHDLAYLESGKHLESARASGAGLLLVYPGCPLDERPRIEVKDPKLAFIRAIALLLPPPPRPLGIHVQATVHPQAAIGKDVFVGAHAVIEAGVQVGDRCHVGPGSVLGALSRLGEDCTLVARVTLYPGVTLGARVLVHAGAVLGSDGFGFTRDEAGRLVKFPQLGGLEIGDDVEIGANATLDRGALGTTRIGSGSKIDNLVQVAHNVQVGRDCALSAQVGIAGSSELEDQVTLAGQVGIAVHVRLQRGAVVGAQAGVPSGKVIRGGEVVWGTPARPLSEFKRQHAQLSTLGELRERLRRLEERLEELAAAAQPKRPPV